jgi:dUTP pyrophosphatase
VRGFEKAKGYEHLDFELPKRGTKHSAGYDIALIEELVIPAGGMKMGITGVKVYMMEDEVFKIYPRSSLSRRHNLTLANNVGIIDSDYYSNPDNDGHIGVTLRNFGNKDVTIKKGERVAQGIFHKFLTVSDEEVINTKREGGFGSTGKN